jgi:hypothetical protein
VAAFEAETGIRVVRDVQDPSEGLEARLLAGNFRIDPVVQCRPQSRRRKSELALFSVD